MGIRIQPAQFPRGEVPDTQNYPVEGATSFLRGAPVDLDATPELIEHPGGATVTGIIGFALEEASAGLGLGPTGRVAVAKATEKQIYIGQVAAGAAAAPSTDLSGLSIGDQLSLIKSTNVDHLNEWFVDSADAVNVTVQISRIDDDLDIVWFFVIASAARAV